MTVSEIQPPTMSPFRSRRFPTSPRAGSGDCRFTSGSSSRSCWRFPSDGPGGTVRSSLELLPKIILRALTALAAPLVVLAILSAIVTNEVKGRLGALMMAFYLLNTLVAMLIGLTLTNLIQPGIGASLYEPSTPTPTLVKKTATELLIDLVPKRSASRSPKPSGATGRADLGARHRPGEDPRPTESPGRNVVSRWWSTC